MVNLERYSQTESLDLYLQGMLDKLGAHSGAAQSEMMVRELRKNPLARYITVSKLPSGALFCSLLI